MAKVDIIQTSFSGGEFGPSLFGRNDIAQYANACEIVQNFLPRPYGPAISTPGTRFVATVSDSSLKTRLIKFIFNRQDAYVIEAGDRYMRFFTNRGQVVEQSGTEDLSAFGGNLKAHWKCNDNTNSTTVLDATGSHSGTASTLTTSMSTTGIVSQAFNLNGIYHVSVSDHDDFTRTASSQPMTIAAWAYYSNNGSSQAVCSKAGEYELSVNSSDKLAFLAYSGNAATKLLLHMDGSDGSTTFTDSSQSANSVTAVGNAQIDTAQSKFGGASGLFDGTGDYLTIPDSADFDFGTGQLTIDFWVRFNALSQEDGLIGISNSASGQDVNDVFTLRINGTDVTKLQFKVISGGSTLIDFSGTHGMSTGNWYHIALIRGWGGNANDWAITVNGTAVATTTASITVPDFTSVVRIADDPLSGNSPLNGWMDELRFVKGQAIWTSNFTPNDSAYQGSVYNSWEVNDDLSEGWHLLAVTFKGDGSSSGDCKIYIDGEAAALTFTADPSFVKMENTSSLFRLGATSAAREKNWKDKIDNVAFIHQELTAAQIATLYSTTPYQIDTVFLENEIFGVHYAQLNDVIWLAHADHPPQKLIRTSANEWTIADASIIGGPFLDENTNTSILITPSGTSGTINLTVTPTTANLFTRSGSTLGHHNAYWMIGGLAQTNTTTGLQEIGYVQITNVVNSYTATATVIKNLKSTSATSVWAEGAWSSVRGYPAKVCFQERRLWYARTNHEPQKEWGSKIFEFDNFALNTEADDDGLNLALASNESNEIQWLAAGKSLIAGTFGGAFVTNSKSTEPITPDNVSASEEVGFGSTSIMPKKIGNLLYYVQRFGKKLREMFYNFDLDSYKSVDRTILSPHILGNGIVDMDYQQNPDTILYCVRTDGTLVTMTREVDQEVAAWARQTTNGTYASVAVIPSQSKDYDEAWVIVERWVNGNQKKYVEYFEDIAVPSRQDQCLYLHSALTYDAYESTSMSSATISLSASSGSVTVTVSTAYFTGEQIGKRIRAIDADGNTLGEGQITATTSTTSLTLSITSTFNALSYAAGFWGISVSSFSGIDHLEAKTIGILADGVTESLTRTVASGSVTVGSDYFVINAGLSYDQILYTLPKEAGAQRGTAQGKLQRINEIALKVNRSYVGFQYGTDSGNLDTLTSVDGTLTQSLTTTIIGNIPFRGGYQRGTQIYIKNSKPLPVELLNIIACIDTQEK